MKKLSIKMIIRLLIGIMFLITALFKLLSIDEFELYVYSFGILNYLLSTLFARLLITFEFIVGAFLIAKQYYRYTWWATLLSLIGFTIFLIYVYFFRNDDNCHCFGVIVELNPLQSIAKNLVLIVLLPFIKGEENWSFRFQKWVKVSVLVLAFAVPFILFPMDSIYNKFISNKATINVAALDEAKTDSAWVDLQIDDGHYAVAFMASGCKYCKLSAKKMKSIFDQNQIDYSRLKIVIFGNAQNVEKFKEETGLKESTYYIISPVTAVKITFGKFPSFAFFEDGEMVSSFDFRGIDEKEWVGFLK